MRKLFTLSFLLFFSFFANAQSIVDSGSCIYHYPFPIPIIDTTYLLCDTTYNPNFVINIEPTSDNVWQKGKTTKFGITNARDTSCAIFTDSINPYPINNYSAFNFIFPKNNLPWGGLNNYYIKFWHQFDTDSLLDGCWLEFSDDTGNSWHRLDSLNGFPMNNFQNGWNACNLYTNTLQSTNQAFDTLLNGTKAWSGNSNGWRYTALWLNMTLPVKPSRGYNINAIRFVFQSDSINTNKLGWMIDDIAIGYVNVGTGLNDITLQNQLPIFPNPSSNGVFTISYPSHYVKGILQVYNLYGQKIKETSLCTEINLSHQPNGMYYYKAFFDNKIYSGVLNKN